MNELAKHQFDPQTLDSFGCAVLEKAGADSDVAARVAEGLTWASLRGVDSHGLRLLPHYVRGLMGGRINGRPQFRWSRKSSGVATLHADNTFGHAAGAMAALEVAERAGKTGIAAAAVSHSSHFGAAGYFANLIAERGLIGFAFTHADSLLQSHGGRRPFFGTNPIAFAAPMEGEGPLCLDMATSHVSWNRILEHRLEAADLEQGWAVDEFGEPTQNPEEATALVPIGGYKGVGLAMMIEVLCALLSGMPFGREISRMYADPIDRPRQLGHFFAAIDPCAFAGAQDFGLRLRDMADALRAEPRHNCGTAVQAPGDPEKRRILERLASGIPISDHLWIEFQELSAQWRVRLPEPAPDARSHSADFSGSYVGA